MSISPANVGLNRNAFNTDKEYRNYRHNLRILSKCKSDSILTIDSKNHARLKEVRLNFLTKIFYRINRSKKEEKVRSLVGSVVKQLGNTEINEKRQELKECRRLLKLKYDEELEETCQHIKADILRMKSEVEDDEINNQLEVLFLDRMKRISSRFFDRADIPLDVLHVLEPALDDKLAKEMHTEDPPEEADGPNTEYKDYIAEKLNRKVTKAQLAIKLGVKLEPISAGMSGSYFAKDYKDKTLGVFKPGNEESLTGDSPKLIDRIKRIAIKLLHITDPAAPFHHKEGFLAEVLTSRLALHLGFKTVQPSQAVPHLDGKSIGSFQLFVKNTKSAKDTVMQLPKEQIENELFAEELEELFVIDFLTFNRDRHHENWLVSEPVFEGKRRIHLIDHGLSFPKAHPIRKDKLYKRNQFKWAHKHEGLPETILNRPFSAGMKEKLEILLNDRNLDALIADFEQTASNAGVYHFRDGEKSQASEFNKRVQVLLKVLNDEKTIAELASLKSAEDIDKFLMYENIEI